MVIDLTFENFKGYAFHITFATNDPCLYSDSLSGKKGKIFKKFIKYIFVCPNILKHHKYRRRYRLTPQINIFYLFGYYHKHQLNIYSLMNHCINTILFNCTMNYIDLLLIIMRMHASNLKRSL